MANRAVTVIGGIGVAAAGYYLYQAGGDPKAAEKRVEHDAARLTSTLKGETSAKSDEARSKGKVLAADAGAQIDSAIANAREQTSKVDAKLDQYRKDAEKSIDSTRKEAGKELNAAVDKFDKTIGEGAAKAKSGIGSWFGGGGK